MVKKKTKSPVVLLLLAGIAVIIIIGSIGCTASGDGSKAFEDYPMMVQDLTEEFGLDPDRVLDVLEQGRENVAEEMQERRAEAGAVMELRFEEMLERALEEGEITAAQMEEILAKRTEIALNIDELSDLPPEERRAANQELRDSTIDWAEENDLDLGVLMGPGQGGHGRSQSRGNGGSNRGSFNKGMGQGHFGGCIFEY